MDVERITKFEDFQKNKEKWNNLLISSELNCIFLTHEWFYSWWESFSQDGSLEILIFKDDEGRVLGIAPMMTQGENLSFIANREITDYCDFITVDSRREEVYESFLECIRIHYAHIKRMELINIKEASPTLDILPKLASRYKMSCSMDEIEGVPTLVLPPSYESYVSDLSRKSRHELRRKLRRMETLDGVQIKRITDGKELKTAIEEFIVLHRESSTEKKEFWEKKGMSGFFKGIVQKFSTRDWIELNCLYVKDKLVASLLNLSYLDEIYFYNMAYDSDYAWYSPGFYLFHNSIKQGIAEEKRMADFLRGREKYKYYFGAKECKIYDLKLSVGKEQG